MTASVIGAQLGNCTDCRNQPDRHEHIEPDEEPFRDVTDRAALIFLGSDSGRHLSPPSLNSAKRNLGASMQPCFMQPCLMHGPFFPV